MNGTIMAATGAVSSFVDMSLKNNRLIEKPAAMTISTINPKIAYRIECLIGHIPPSPRVCDHDVSLTMHSTARSKSDAIRACTA
jgi:hypothetical protein